RPLKRVPVSVRVRLGVPATCPRFAALCIAWQSADNSLYELESAMRIVISEFVSLDGVSQAPGGPDEDRDGGFEHGGLSVPFFDAEAMGAALGAAMAATDALLFGRRTWQGMAAAWPERAGDPFADRMNEITKYVVSSTLAPDEVTWTNSNLVPARDLEATVR